MRHPVRTTLAPCFVSLALEVSVAVAASVPRIPVRLDGPGLPTSDVLVATPPPEATVDGRYVVYVHDPVVENARELYSVRREGGEPVRLSAPLPAGERVHWFAIAAGGRVVYQVAQETPGKQELWSVPITGPAGASVRLSPPLQSSGFAGHAALTPDRTRVVFGARVTTAGALELWSARVDGSEPPVRVSPVPVGRLSVSPGFRLTPDSTRVVFAGDFAVDGEVMLWSAPVDGSAAAVRLSLIHLHAGADVSRFELTPDGTQAVFLHDRVVDGRLELYRRPVDGSSGSLLSPVSTVSPSSAGDVLHFWIAPDSTRVAFRADLQVDERVDLWTVPLDGSQHDAVVVSPPLVAGRDARDAVFSPDSSRLVFLADEGAQYQYDLWSAPADGSASAVRLNPALAANEDVYLARFSPDGSRVLYQDWSGSRHRLWTVPAAGPFLAATELSMSSWSERAVHQWWVDGSGQVVLLADLEAGDGSGPEVSRVPIDGSGPRTTLFSSTPELALSTWPLMPSGRTHVLLLGNTPGGRRLLEMPLDGSEPPTAIDVEPAGYGLVATPQLIAGRRGVLFAGDYDAEGEFGLWMSWVDEQPIFAEDFESGTIGGFGD